MRLALLFPVCFFLIGAISCQSTGDPNRGGLFGWSEAEADERLESKRKELDRLESDTASERRRNDVLDKKKRYLEYESY